MLEFKEKICPFCNKDNNCKVLEAKSCWCMSIKVPSDLLELLPLENKKKSCICQSCVLEFKNNPTEFKKKYKLFKK